MTRKKVLLFYPPNKRSIAIETLCRTVKEAGHELSILTLTEKGSFHEALEKKGIQTFAHVVERKHSWKYFIKHARYLIKFCKQQKIDVVFSHLQEGNIIAVMAQPFLKARLIAFRHHAESRFYAEFGKQFGMRRNRKEVLLDKMINRLAKKIVVPSTDVWNGMDKYERCNMKKVLLLPYIYDFSAYPQPDQDKVKSLREQYPCQLMLIMVSRMIVSKQHLPVFKVVKKMIDEGLSLKMIVMDDGPLREQLVEFIEKNNLTGDIIMTGFREDFINYMTAADLLVHPSVTEASNNVAKEMGLLEKGIAVSRHVGDFDDYITDNRNGYFLESSNLEQTIESAIRDAYVNPDKLKEFGKELKKDVLRYFSDSSENRQRFLDLLN